jgi:Family of unknown function (DUF5989)
VIPNVLGAALGLLAGSVWAGLLCGIQESQKRAAYGIGKVTTTPCDPPKPGFGLSGRNNIDGSHGLTTLYPISNTIIKRRMRFIRNTARNFGIAGELLVFFWNKRWWLVPVMVTLFLLIALIALAQSSAIAPFIYTLF